MSGSLSICKPIEVTRRVLSFLALQTMADAEFPHGRRYYTKSGYFKTLADSSIDHMVEALASIPSPMTQIELAYLGGAAARVGAAETAFGDRSSPFVVNVLGNWSDAAEDAANIAWDRTLFGRIRPQGAFSRQPSALSKISHSTGLPIAEPTLRRAWLQYRVGGKRGSNPA